jgi:hypothetical protein
MRTIIACGTTGPHLHRDSSTSAPGLTHIGIGPHLHRDSPTCATVGRLAFERTVDVDSPKSETKKKNLHRDCRYLIRTRLRSFDRLNATAALSKACRPTEARPSAPAVDARGRCDFAAMLRTAPWILPINR